MMDRRATTLPKTLASLVAVLALGGCAAFEFPPQPLIVTAVVSSDATPLAAPMALEPHFFPYSPRFNRLGGEIPKPAPQPEIDELELDDIPTG